MTPRITTPRRVALLLSTATLALAGCAGSGGADDGEGASLGKEEIYSIGVVGDQPAAGEPTDGGTLTIVDYAEARSLDPTQTIPNGAVGGNAMAAVYDVLVSYDPEEGTYRPHLAESLETSDDVTWTLTLRDGVTFSDGTALDAEAVVDSIEYYMQNHGFNSVLLHANVKQMKAQDERTVVVTLNRPWATFPAMLAAGPGMILAPAAIDGGPDAFEPIGAGPFLLDDYKPAEELVLTRNAGYWGEQPHLEALRFVWLGADDAKIESLDAGSVDVVSVRNPEVLEDVRRAGRPGFMNPQGLGSMLWINNREGNPGQDPRIREAINRAIDPAAYMERANGDAGMPSRNIYSQAYPYFTDVETVDHDPERAKELVEEAKADGVDTELVYIGQSDQASQTTAVTVEAQLEAAGFTVELDLLRNVADQTNRIYVTHDYDLAVSAMSIGEDPYSTFASNLSSQAPSNPSGYGSEEMDRLIGELQAVTPAEGTDVLTQINELWQQDLPGVALAEGGFFSPWQDDVHGVRPTAQGIMLFHEAWKG